MRDHADCWCRLQFSLRPFTSWGLSSTINRPEIMLEWIPFWESLNSSELAVFQDLYVSDVPEDLELHSEILPEGAPKKNAEMMLFARCRGREREREMLTPQAVDHVEAFSPCLCQSVNKVLLVEMFSGVSNLFNLKNLEPTTKKLPKMRIIHKTIRLFGSF